MPFYGWIVIGFSALFTFSSGAGQAQVFAVFVDPILTDSGLSRTALAALFALGAAFGALLVGFLTRQIDRRGARVMLTLNGLGLGAACIVIGLAQGPAGFLAGFAGLRTFGLALPVAASILAAQWFVRRRGRAMAIVGLGVAASNAALPIVSRLLIDSIGWRTAFSALGVGAWLLIIPPALWLVRNQPEDVGLYPDGAAEPPISEVVSGPFDRAQHQRRVLRSLNFWLLAFAMAATPFISVSVIFHQVSIFADHGLSADVAAGVFLAFAVANASMTAVSGLLVDRLGPKLVLLANLAVILSGLAVLQFMATTSVAVVYALIMGASAGMELILARVALPYYYGRRGLGSIQGPATSVVIASRALAPVAFAALHDTFGGYGPGLVVLAAVGITAIILTSLFKPPLDPA